MSCILIYFFRGLGCAADSDNVLSKQNIQQAGIQYLLFFIYFGGMTSNDLH